MQFDIVFEGGGAKGMVFVGAMRAFEAAGHTFGRLLGTSAGAITAALLTVGYNADEMAVALGEVTPDGRPVFESFMGAPLEPTPEELAASHLMKLLQEIDIPGVPDFIERGLDRLLLQLMRAEGRPRHFFHLVEKGGWFTPQAFVEWMQARLDAPRPDGTTRGFGRCTLAELHARTGRQLSVIATDTTDRRMMVLNHRTAPDMPVVMAVRASMNLPMVWPEVVWQAGWGTYRGRDVTGHCLVDGGVLSNFPLELLVSRARPILEIMGEGESEGGAIGMLIDEHVPVPGVEVDPGEGGILGHLQTVGRLSRLLDTMMVANDKMVIETLAHRVVHLPARGIGTMEFGMPPERRRLIVDAAIEATRAFFENVEQVIFDGPSFYGGDSPADLLAARMLDQ